MDLVPPMFPISKSDTDTKTLVHGNTDSDSIEMGTYTHLDTYSAMKRDNEKVMISLISNNKVKVF